MISKTVEVEEREDEMDRDGDSNFSLDNLLKTLATVVWMMVSRGLFCEKTCRMLFKKQASIRLQHQDGQKQTHMEDFITVE